MEQNDCGPVVVENFGEAWNGASGCSLLDRDSGGWLAWLGWIIISAEWFDHRIG